MILCVLGHKFHYEMENICRIFFPQEKIKVVYTGGTELDKKVVMTKLERKDNSVVISVRVDIGSEAKACTKIVEDVNGADASELERQMALALYTVLTRVTGYIPGWGIITGVRPAKLMATLIEEYGEPEAINYFREKLLVGKEKTELTFSVVKKEEEIIRKAKENCFSLYISIPFCPSRCSYCSFVSQSITGQKAKEQVSDYVVNLCREIESIGKVSVRLGLKPQTVYFGGGTPTTLDEKDLETLFKAVNRIFDLSEVDEYTVEAGRPDTITPGKLQLMKKYGVSRISINPQSFNDAVLETAHRKHTSGCTIDAFKLARSVGFSVINMDLIAGLPEETYESFLNSLDITIGLAPENITIHSLALKRSSSLTLKGNVSFNGEAVSAMIREAKIKLESSGYTPYYMYRQSLSPGNNENTGWCKAGYESLYNVFMMEECQTVLAAGAGAVTKLKQRAGKHIERIFNFKYPFEYNNRFEEMITRKSRIEEFYSEFG
ncbi:MAG: coproporphyrinogen dehydrogenase HemZ [Clostridiales bacterium]|nr:coproporphyrinogen dehydrogenase HemZ [Clostridiales bacterium]